MRDPYLYDDIDVLKNKLGIKDFDRLENAEAAITLAALADVDQFESGEFNIEKLKNIHKHIFGDIYEWAGEFRKINIEKQEIVLGGLSVQYSNHKEISHDVQKVLDKFNLANWNGLNLSQTAELITKLTADLWKVHCFREGNTRTTITFVELFIKTKGIEIDKELLKKHSTYVRDSLVLSSLGEYSEYNHLNKIIKDSIIKGFNYKIKNSELENKNINDENKRSNSPYKKKNSYKGNEER